MSAERLYYTDSFLRRFAARVTAVREQAGDEAARWQVALDRTAFYPTSGGQPFDTGRLQAEEGRELPVASVMEDDDGEVWHATGERLEPGTTIEGAIDWERRLDHMQQHSGQHLLSAIFVSRLQAPTVSFHLGDVSSTIDLACGALPGAELERVEEEANRIIAEDRPVTTRVVARAEAEALLAAGALRKLPEREGAIRLVEIADCDRNACGGTHVRSTGQIGGLWLRGTEKVGRGWRVGFVCGLRAVRAGRADAATLRQATAALSVSSADVPAAIERLLTEAKAGARERQRLREALAQAQGARLAAETAVAGRLRLIEAACDDGDVDFVRLLAARAAAAMPATVAVLSAVAGPKARIVLARSGDLDFDCGALMKQALAERGLRGGGSVDLAQGEVASEAAAELRATLAARVRAVAG